MTHLTLVATPRPSRRAAPDDTPRPVPTQEFLARRILALQLGDQTIGAALSEMAAYLEPDAADALQRASAITDALMLVGIWVFPPVEDEDPPTHGMVVHPSKLAKRFPELKRLLPEMEHLVLNPPAA